MYLPFLATPDIVKSTMTKWAQRLINLEIPVLVCQQDGTKKQKKELVQTATLSHLTSSMQIKIGRPLNLRISASLRYVYSLSLIHI